MTFVGAVAEIPPLTTAALTELDADIDDDRKFTNKRATTASTDFGGRGRESVRNTLVTLVQRVLAGRSDEPATAPR